MLFDETIKVLGKVSWFRQVFFNPEKTYKIYYHAHDRHNQKLVERKQIIVNKDYYDNKLNKNGFLTLK
jgi:hypothetical protein